MPNRVQYIYIREKNHKLNTVAYPLPLIFDVSSLILLLLFAPPRGVYAPACTIGWQRYQCCHYCYCSQHYLQRPNSDREREAMSSTCACAVCFILLSFLLQSSDRERFAIAPVQSQYETLQYTHSNIPIRVAIISSGSPSV